MVMIVGETVWMMEQNFLVLYTKDRYNWSQVQMMHVNTYNFAIIIFGQFAVFPFLRQILKLPIMLIGCLTCISRAGYYGLFASCVR